MKALKPLLVATCLGMALCAFGAERGAAVKSKTPAPGTSGLPPGWAAEMKRVTVATPGGDIEKEVTYYTNTIGMKLVPIPAGEFMMGSHESAEDVARAVGGKVKYYKDQHPRHKVRITKPFYMGAHEVTNAQFRRFKDNHNSKEYKGLSLNGDDQPAVYVSWEDAKAFCEWLSRKEGVMYRLPTEAEWEYACRAGSSGRYWWGENERLAGQYANVADTAAKKKWPAWPARWVVETYDGHAVAAPVGSFTANAFGLHDMIGNVWEWCEDWYGENYYAASPQADPKNRAIGKCRVLRGGSWRFGAINLRSATRCYGAPSSTDYISGFRVLSLSRGVR